MSVSIDDYDRPLRPLSVPEHMARYQAIDNFIEQFNEFKTALDDGADPSAKGHLFVVTGDRGYGKTSLRQRCAIWMLSEFSKNHPGCEVVVVDLSDEDWKGDTIEARVLRTRDCILEELTGPVASGDIGNIRTITDMADSFRMLGRRLRTRGAEDGKARPVIPVVLLPGYPVAAELEQYYKLVREGMVFIAEIFNPEVVRDVTEKVTKRYEGFERDGVRVRVLPLGVLKPGDDELLMKWIQADVRNCPQLTNAAVVADFNRLIQERKISVSRLMKLLIGVLRIAMAESKNEVTPDHIRMYYENQVFGPA